MSVGPDVSWSGNPALTPDSVSEAVPSVSRPFFLPPEIIFGAPAGSDGLRPDCARAGVGRSPMPSSSVFSETSKAVASTSRVAAVALESGGFKRT